jgi:hypothetical protein
MSQGSNQGSNSKFKATTTDSQTLAVLGNATAGMNTIAEQFTTIGIVAAMVIVIGMLMALFVYTQYFR